jgi:hypothetical protein
VALFGTSLAWSCEGIAEDPLLALLELLEPEAAEGPGRVRFALRPAGAAEAADPRDEGWVPSFFHGVVQAYRGASGFLLHDRASRVWIPDGEGLVEAALVAPDREPFPGSTEATLQIALALALRRERLFHLHAAGLILPSGAATIVIGASGAGKTTTTLALLEAGGDYLADDALFLREEPARGVEVLGFPRPFHLGAATLAAFPRLAPLAGSAPAGTDKRPLDARVAYPQRRRAGFSAGAGIIAIFPRVTPEDATVVEPLARAEAFGHLLASSAAVVLDGITRRDENLAVLRALLGAARAFEVRLGRDALAAPTVIAARLAQRV